MIFIETPLTENPENRKVAAVCLYSATISNKYLSEQLKSNKGSVKVFNSQALAFSHNYGIMEI